MSQPPQRPCQHSTGNWERATANGRRSNRLRPRHRPPWSQSTSSRQSYQQLTQWTEAGTLLRRLSSSASPPDASLQPTCRGDQQQILHPSRLGGQPALAVVRPGGTLESSLATDASSEKQNHAPKTASSCGKGMTFSRATACRWRVERGADVELFELAARSNASRRPLANSRRRKSRQPNVPRR